MSVNKSKTAAALAAIIGMIYVVPASAELLIHTGRAHQTINQGLIGVGSHVTNLGAPYYLKKNVVGFGKDIPLSLAMDSLKPAGWRVVYNSDVMSDQPVSWARSGNWNNVLEDIAKNNNLVAVINWGDHQIRLMEMIPTGSDAARDVMSSISSADDSPFSKNSTNKTSVIKHSQGGVIETVETVVDSHVSAKANDIKSAQPSEKVSKKMEDSIKLVNGLIYSQDDGGCTNKKVNIERMVMDTSWLGDGKKSSSKNSVGSKSGLQSTTVGGSLSTSVSNVNPEKSDLDKEMARIAKDKIRIKKLRGEYKDAYILSGNGSFQDFVNGGGIIDSASETHKYTYVYKKGMLFDTIKRWSDKNGFVVKNDVFDNHHIDYENVADVKLGGTYKEVVTTVLSKYRNASMPIMFTFYEAGGSKVLHIFESKYRSSYI